VNLPRPSDLTATQCAAIVAADDKTGIIPAHFPRVTIRSLFMRHLAQRVEHDQIGGLIPARLTIDGRAMRAELLDRRRR
jgi:hypothetical protein